MPNKVLFGPEKIASTTDFGLMKVGNGLEVNSGAGIVSTNNASDGSIKLGTSTSQVINPKRQHLAVFYGLAAAAGDTTQAASDNAVGTYTTGAQNSIQVMLNVPSKSNTILTNGLTLDGSISAGRKADTTIGFRSIAIGNNPEASAQYAVALGYRSLASFQGAYSYGDYTSASGLYAHAEGLGKAKNNYADPAYGAIGYYSHSEGITTTSVGYGSHAEGYFCKSTGSCSHVEGYACETSTAFGHAEGIGNIAGGEGSHAEGTWNAALGCAEHAGGQNSVLNIYPRWTASTSYSVGDKVLKDSVALICTVANSDDTFNYEHWDYTHTFLEKIGNGEFDYDNLQPGNSSNARVLDWDGNEKLKGYLYVGCNADSSGGTRVPHDIQINSTSIVSNGIANIPIAAIGTLGAVSWDGDYGISANASGRIYVNKATSTQIPLGTAQYRPIVPYNQHESVFYGLAKAAGDTYQASSSNSVGNYEEPARSKISEMLNAPTTITASSVNIGAFPGVRYICGEMTTLSITAPESGCIDVLFKSGSTPTTLTITSAKSGVSAIKWANGFNPAAIEANATYEINILDGEYGVACKWT